MRAGLSDPIAGGLEGWLDRTLAEVRDTTGDGWPDFRAHAQDLRFWVRRAVLGRSLIGVLHPLQDRSGRRYPLVLAAEGVALPAPIVDGDQTSYIALARHLDTMQPGQGAAVLLSGLTLNLPGETAQDALSGPTLWAHHPTGDLDALLRSAGPVDAARSMLLRSYWWAPGMPATEDTSGHAAVWLGCPGLPGAQALGWLLTGVAPEEAADER